MPLYQDASEKHMFYTPNNRKQYLSSIIVAKFLRGGNRSTSTDLQSLRSN